MCPAIEKRWIKNIAQSPASIALFSTAAAFCYRNEQDVRCTGETPGINPARSHSRGSLRPKLCPEFFPVCPFLWGEYTRAEPPKKPQNVNKSQFEAKQTPGQTGITRAEIRNPNSELRKKAILALPGRATGRTQTRAADARRVFCSRPRGCWCRVRR